METKRNGKRNASLVHSPSAIKMALLTGRKTAVPPVYPRKRGAINFLMRIFTQHYLQSFLVFQSTPDSSPCPDGTSLIYIYSFLSCDKCGKLFRSFCFILLLFALVSQPGSFRTACPTGRTDKNP